MPLRIMSQPKRRVTATPEIQGTQMAKRPAMMSRTLRAIDQLMVLDEISGLLGQRLVTRVATLSQITELLKKTEQSQRVLDEASEGLAFDVLTDDESSDENISIERLTGERDISPI